MNSEEIIVYQLIKNSPGRITQLQICRSGAWVGSHPKHEAHLPIDHEQSTLRKVRQIIRDLRLKQNLPIISDKDGYWIPTTQGEAEEYILRIERTARAQAKAWNETYSAMNKMFNVRSNYFEQQKLTEMEDTQNKDEQKFKLSRALEIATRVVNELRPFCERIEIAGSIRRGKPEVKDIEIVAIPKPYEVGLFEDGIASIVNQWQRIKGVMDGKTKYTQRLLPEGIKLDLFFAVPQNWGLILAIRTGSAEFSHKVLANGWAKKGYKSVDGMLTQGDRIFDVREEADLFTRIGIEFVDPSKREVI